MLFFNYCFLLYLVIKNGDLSGLTLLRVNRVARLDAPKKPRVAAAFLAHHSFVVVAAAAVIVIIATMFYQ